MVKIVGNEDYSGVNIILKHRDFWGNKNWNEEIIPFIFDPNHTTKSGPEWMEPPPSLAIISETRKELGPPKNPDEISTPVELLLAIKYWLQFTDTFSEDKELKKIDCTILVIKGRELAEKVKIILHQPPKGKCIAERATNELKYISNEIYLTDNSIQVAIALCEEWEEWANKLSRGQTSKRFLFPERGLDRLISLLKDSHLETVALKNLTPEDTESYKHAYENVKKYKATLKERIQNGEKNFTDAISGPAKLRAERAKDKLLIKLNGIGDPAIVCGNEKKITGREYLFLKALIDAHPNRLGTTQLENNAKRTDPSKVFIKLRKTDKDWEKALSLPGENGKGYGINSE